MKNKPISLRKVLKDAFYLYKKYFFLLFVSFFLIELISKFHPTESFDKSYIIYFLVSNLITTFIYATTVIHLNSSQKNRVSPLISIKNAWSRFIPLLINDSIVFLLFILGLIVFIIPGIFVGVVFDQAWLFVLLKNKGPLESLALSRRLTKGNRIKILVIDLFYYFLVALGFVFIFMKVPGFYNENILTNFLSFLSGSSSLILYYSLWRNLQAASSIK